MGKFIVLKMINGKTVAIRKDLINEVEDFGSHRFVGFYTCRSAICGCRVVEEFSEILKQIEE